MRHVIQPSPITAEEVSDALARSRPNTSSGIDAACDTAIRAFFADDSNGKLVGFFNKILDGTTPVPPAWTRGKLCFIPTCARPARPQDLRPISLTPCLGKIFARILVNRLSPKFPSYRAGQHACRKGSQALEAVTCAQASMKLFRAATGRGLHLMKLDVSQAFDTLSHHAIWRFFLETDRCAEASVLWDLCRNTCVDMQLGSESWSQHLGRGVLQGTSFSADLFARTLDFFVSGTLSQWCRSSHDIFRRLDLPHVLLYADDILVLASSAAELQVKLHDLQNCLSAIGLHINTAKCSVLHDDGGTCPGVWPLHACRPLQGSDDIIYLGVPLSHEQTPLGQLGLSLAKVSSSFFGLRRIFDHPSTAVETKLELFRSYVTAKWAWCAPASWPSRRSLKGIDAFKHTLIVALEN